MGVGPAPLAEPDGTRMKRAVLFLLFGGLGVAGLVHLSGGIEGPAAKRSAPDNAPAQARVEDQPETPQGTPISVPLRGPNVMTPGGANARMMSKTQTLSWTDPATGDVLEIRGWFSWSFETASFEGLPQGDAATQGVLCKDVVLELYREPLTRSEALRRIEGDLRPVLRQRFTASRARAYGSIAQKLNDRTGKRETSPGPDTRIDLLGDVLITDVSQGLRITGSKLRVYPVQERVEGSGKFRVEHEAMTLTGTTLNMERHERGWTRVEILKNTVLDMHSDVRDEQGKPMFSFGQGEFRPANVVSDGRAIFLREQGRREGRLRLTFPDGVTATQDGGRQLEAGWLELLATQPAGVTTSATTKSAPWTLRDLRAEDSVRVEYTSSAKEGRSHLMSIAADRLTHSVPVVGRSRTELFGEPRIVVRGQLSLDETGSPDDRMHITCRNRAWIEPLTSAEVDPGLDASRMQRMALRGGARIERHGRGPSASEDVLEGESIDLLLLEQDLPAGKTRTVAVQFTATEDVRLGGSRIRGHTTRLVAQGLHTPQPHIFAEGSGTTFTIPLVQRDQGLLGPREPEAPSEPEAGEAEEEPSTDEADVDAPDEPSSRSGSQRVRWLLRRLLARGDVIVETQLGGASVGIPARVTALEASYEAEHRLARLNGRAGAPVRILSTVAPGETNLVEAQTMTLDRARGVIWARHGVRGELYMSEQGGFGAGGRAPKASQALEMSVRTDARIDLYLARTPQGWSPKLDQEQRISVQGPLVAELKSENLTVDRMRARTLDVVLSAAPPKPPRPQSVATAPTARAASPSATGRRTSAAPSGPRRPIKRSRVDVTARDVRVQLLDGDVSQLDATGGVDLKGRPGHVTGERMTYDAKTHRIEIMAGNDAVRRPATALLGATASRTEIEGARLGLIWKDDRAQSADATAPAGQKSRIRLFRRNPKTPDTLERYELRYEGTIHLRPNELTASRVIVIRSEKDMRTQQSKPPSALYTSRLQLFGANLLSREAVSISRMVAQGKGTYFRSEQSGKLLQAWGDRFDYDVDAGWATLSGAPQDDVVLKWGDNESYFPSLRIDVAKGLPFAPDGTYILLRKKR